MERIVRLSMLVDDYDKAINFYCSQANLFTVVADLALGSGQRNVVLRYLDLPFCLVLFRALTPETSKLIGHQGGELPLLVLPVTDCLSTHDQLLRNGVAFEGEPLQLPYGCQATMIDPFGNRICLSERY